MLLTPLHALQVYGDAVMDEAPLLILTNYHVTVFLKRSGNVLDKRLWASEPIWFDQTDPPARASWLHALQQAEELRDLKQRLPRARVPPTAEGYHIQPRPQQAHMQQQQQAAAEQQAEEAGSGGRSRQRRIAEQLAEEAGSGGRSQRRRIADQLAEEPAPISLCLRARIPSGKGYELDFQQPPTPPPAAANIRDPGADETLAMSELGVTDKLLGEGQYGHTLKVSLSAPQTAHLLLMHLACIECR